MAGNEAQGAVQQMNTVMHLSPEGVAAIYRRECSNGVPALEAYEDGSGNLTIGCGHTGPDVFKGQTITAEQADELFRKDIAPCEVAVNAYVSVSLTQNEFDALCSFTFNVGVGAFERSTLLKKLNKGQYDQVPVELRKWNVSAGKINQGLVNRRNSEIGQWTRGAFVSSASVSVDPPQSVFSQAHAQLKALGVTILSAGSILNGDSLKNAGSDLQGLATHSHWFLIGGLALILAGIGYNLFKPKT